MSVSLTKSTAPAAFYTLKDTSGHGTVRHALRVLDKKLTGHGTPRRWFVQAWDADANGVGWISTVTKRAAFAEIALHRETGKFSV